MDTLGIDVVYLPIYSPKLNPIEFAFKMEEMRLLVEANLHVAVYSALDQITVNDMPGFYRETI